MKSVLKYIFYLFILTEINAQTLLDINKFRIYPSSVTQTEPVAAVHPLNNSFIFSSAVTFNLSNGFKSEGVYVTTDGGINWSGSDTCKGEFIFNHGGDPGVVITESGRLILSHIGAFFPGMYTHYSNDSGKTWSPAYTVTDHQTSDKGTITIDNSTQSSYYGRVYLAYTEVVNPFSVVVSYSSDEGENWSTPQIINPNPPKRCVGGSVATASNGNVYVCWSGITETSPFREDYAGFASSTDGGNTWAVQQNIFDMNGINGTLASKEGIKVNGLPQVAVDNSGGVRDGWIYIVTTETNLSPAGSDPDIILRYSTDNGSTWSAGVRVNQDQINNSKIQYFPALEIDNNGGINILFYDDRNTSSDSTDVFLTRSVDGGNSWQEFSIVNSRFKPEPILGGPSAYQGDHIALLSAGNKMHAFWMADYSGIYQVWSVPIDLNALGVDETYYHLNDFNLSQNYPNPFNPSTKLSFVIGHQSFVTLRIFDVLGNEVAVLMSEDKLPGKYEIEFSADYLSSGVYFCKLNAGSFSQTIKMMLIR